MSRRSPVRHGVGGYTRQDGTYVGEYERGEGEHMNDPRRGRVVGEIEDPLDDDSAPIGVHGFVINFKYSDEPDDGESVLVISDNFEDASDEAWEERVDPRMPIAVETIDPDIGAMLEWVADRGKSAIKYGTPKIKKAAHLGAKYTVKASMGAGRLGAKAARVGVRGGRRVAGAGLRGGASVARAGVRGTKEVGRLAAFGAQKELAQSLLKLCYQEDPAKRMAARVALKRRYPTIYDMCDFSNEPRGMSRYRSRRY